MTKKLLQPNEIAKKAGINKNTLNGYLDDRELFPPEKINDGNGYRYYSVNTVETIILFKALGKKPFRFNKVEKKDILQKLDNNKLTQLYNKSKKKLILYLQEKNIY
jgi:DNA-binding transcriptional MerR regulator